MSAGELTFASYYRASQLGAGTYGSVVVVYNDEGQEFALKVFTADDDEDNDDDNLYTSSLTDLGAMREISCLRLLRGTYRHPNITTLIDVQPQWGEEEDEDYQNEDCNDRKNKNHSSGCLSMALPLYRGGSLQDALEKGFFTSSRRIVKVKLAHQLLLAVAYLHDNMILHRDIKPDNIMLHHGSDDDNHDDKEDEWRPVLIDFSLAKLLSSSVDMTDEPVQHTGEVGTPTYTAPEVVAQEPYGAPSDLWSVGVVLLLLLQNHALEATKDRHASAWIEYTLDQQLPVDQPFPDLIRGLLQKDPQKRLTARQALQHPLFAKFGLEVPPVRLINIAEALPLEDPSSLDDHDDDHDDENCTPNNNQQQQTQSSQKRSHRRLKQRVRLVHSLCRDLCAQNPYTPLAALEYCQAMTQLEEDIDDLSKSQSLLHCVILAFRFFETDVLDLKYLHNTTSGKFSNWTLEDYVDDEATIFMMMDFCLYPRNNLKEQRLWWKR